MSDLAPGKPTTQSAKDELLQLLELLRVESGQPNKAAAHHDRLAVEKVEAEAVVSLTAERDRARDDYRWMVEHAADQKLDGYRELGARAAAAETRAERTEAQLAEAISWAWNLGDELDSNHARWVVGQLADRLSVKVTLPPENEPNNRLREQLAEKDREIDSLELDVAQADTRVEQADNRAAAQVALTEAAERWADTPADDLDIHEIEAALLDTITKFRATLADSERKAVEHVVGIDTFVIRAAGRAWNVPRPVIEELQRLAAEGERKRLRPYTDHLDSCQLRTPCDVDRAIHDEEYAAWVKSIAVCNCGLLDLSSEPEEKR